MVRAIISFPVPVSPTIRTAAGCRDTCSASFSTRLSASLCAIRPFELHELWGVAGNLAPLGLRQSSRNIANLASQPGCRNDEGSPGVQASTEYKRSVTKVPLPSLHGVPVSSLRLSLRNLHTALLTRMTEFAGIDITHTRPRILSLLDAVAVTI